MQVEQKWTVGTRTISSISLYNRSTNSRVKSSTTAESANSITTSRQKSLTFEGTMKNQRERVESCSDVLGSINQREGESLKSFSDVLGPNAMDSCCKVKAMRCHPLDYDNSQQKMCLESKKRKMLHGTKTKSRKNDAGASAVPWCRETRTGTYSGIYMRASWWSWWTSFARWGRSRFK